MTDKSSKKGRGPDRRQGDRRKAAAPIQGKDRRQAPRREKTERRAAR